MGMSECFGMPFEKKIFLRFKRFGLIALNDFIHWKTETAAFSLG